jgi:hypothetical protein
MNVNEILIEIKSIFEGKGYRRPERLLIRLVKPRGRRTGVNEEGQPTSAVFATLGLSIASLKSMSAVDALSAISKAMSQLPTDADKTRAALFPMPQSSLPGGLLARSIPCFHPTGWRPVDMRRREQPSEQAFILKSHTS